MKSLQDLLQGETGTITKVKGRGAFRKRIMEMGFVAGKQVTAIKKAPLQDPVEYSLMGYNVSLRNSEASLIEIACSDTPEQQLNYGYSGVFIEESANNQTPRKDRIINVALVGNPNAGKTTLFNSASGSRERVGNYGGVTVDAKEVDFKHQNFHIRLTDLPGTYSITSYTPEEIFVRSHIFDRLPDIVINVVDASNLERNLYLTTQLIDMDIRVIMALNMYDELEKKGDLLDYQALGKLLGIPIVPTIGSKHKGIDELFDKVIEVYEDREPIVRHIHINYGPSIEKSLHAIQGKIKIPENASLTDRVSSRFLAIKLLENDAEELKRIKACKNHSQLTAVTKHERKRIETLTGENAESTITDAKYGFINGALKETVKPSENTERKTSEIIDVFLTHKLFGLPVFALLMWLMFQATFTFGSYPVAWIEAGVGWISGIVHSLMADGILKDLMINGIIGGIGGVIVFMPNILLLFFFISLMEDTGYMARAVFITDKLMHKIGLHGKSFIPLLMGFGCTVPAIMATRTLENRNDRMITMLINPFMSCSARLPVYILLLGAFFPGNSGTILFLLYLIGIAFAVVVALLLKKTMFRRQEVPFVMELPPYRIPTFKVIVLHMWDKGVQYLKKIGGIILIASIIIWALGYFPVNIEYSKDYDTLIKSTQQAYQHQVDYAKLQGNADTIMYQDAMNEAISTLENERYIERQENSYIAQMGRFVEPMFSPLGFDWRMCVSIIAGVAGKEVVVSTMAVLYGGSAIENEDTETLMTKLKTQQHASGPRMGEPLFTPLVALSFMIFVLLYFPCMSTIAVIASESGSWKWGVFAIIYTTAIAWVTSWVVFMVGGWF